MISFDEIEVHVEAERLFKIEPEGDFRSKEIPPSKRRRIYVRPEVKAFLDSDDPLAGNTQADLNEYILRGTFNVTLQLDHQDCLMARLDRPSDEVWEIRIYDYDTPQLRLFGRFARLDTFIALVGPYSRRKLWWKSYEAIKRACKTVWKSLFGSRSPISKGDDIDAYLSEPVTLI